MIMQVITEPVVIMQVITEPAVIMQVVTDPLIILAVHEVRSFMRFASPGQRDIAVHHRRAASRAESGDPQR